jgi:hypothetical protein
MTARRGAMIWTALLVVMRARQKTTAILRNQKTTEQCSNLPASQCKLSGLAASAR